jgi:capsular exopolysaccharide synthesis family protein
MDLDLRAYARMLSKRKWIALATFAVCVALGALVTAQASPIYRSATTLFVGEQQVSLTEAQEGVFVRNLSVGLLKSYVEIIESRSIAQRAIVDGGLDVSPGQIAAGLQAQAIIDTQIIELTYSGSDPPRAQRIANAVADAFVAEIDRLGEQAGGDPAVTIDIIDRAVTPGSPISPNPTRNMTLAALLGLLAAAGLVVLVEYLDVSVKHRDEIEALGLHVIGSIPRLSTQGADVYLERDTQGIAGEAFRKLRTSVGFINLEQPTRSILITSSLAQEGKTTTSLNLAMAYALGGLRTILVEADLRRPSLHRVFGMIGTRGLTTAIVGDVPLTEAIMQTDTRNLSVLVAGAIPPNPVELLGSDQMTELLERLERMYDIVVIDSPPLVPVADPAALAGRCDGVIIVARSGKTDRRRLLDGARVIERAGGHLLGVVLNFLKPSDAPYDYNYYYGYRTADRPAGQAGSGQGAEGPQTPVGPHGPARRPMGTMGEEPR